MSTEPAENEQQQIWRPFQPQPSNINGQPKTSIFTQSDDVSFRQQEQFPLAMQSFSGVGEQSNGSHNLTLNDLADIAVRMS